MEKEIEEKVKEIYFRWCKGTLAEEDIDYLFELDHAMGETKSTKIRAILGELDLTKYINRFIEKRNGKCILDLSNIVFPEGLDLYDIIYGFDGYLDQQEEIGNYEEMEKLFDDIEEVNLQNCEISDRLTTISKSVNLSNTQLISESYDGFICNLSTYLESLNLESTALNGLGIHFTDLKIASLINMDNFSCEGYVSFDDLSTVDIFTARGVYLSSFDYKEAILGLQLPNLTKYGVIYLDDTELYDMDLSKISNLSNVFFNNTSIKRLYLGDNIDMKSVNLSQLYNCEEIFPNFLDELNINKSDRLK